MRRFFWIALLLSIAQPVHAEPSEKQIAHDAADFRRFYHRALAQSAAYSKPTDPDAAAKFISAECRKLAHQTSPDYLFGVFRALFEDTSQTEEPYLTAEILALAYPHEAARKVLVEIQKKPNANKEEIQAWIEDIDKAEKGVLQ